MKKCLLGLCGLFGLALSALSAPMASQAWVESRISDTKAWTKEYVATNSPSLSSAFAPVSWQSIDENGNAVTITMTPGVATNVGAVVYDSNVPGLTNGTLFAKVGNYTYVNSQNESCKVISGRLDRLYTYYGDGVTEVVTNSTPWVTNTVYASTNSVYGGKYECEIATVTFRGVETLNNFISFGSVSNAVPLRFKLRETKLIDGELSILTAVSSTERSAFSIWDIFFPSCYAWSYGPKEYEGEPVIVGHGSGKVKYEQPYKKHAYTDRGDAVRVVLGEISVGTLIYHFNDVEILRIDAGEHIEDVRKKLPTSVEEIENKIKAKVGPVRWRIHFQNNGKFVSKINSIISGCNAEISKYSSITCPDFGEDTWTTDHDCANDESATFSGECGDWSCDICQKHWEAMEFNGRDYKEKHSWIAEYDPCHICGNPHCEYYSKSESEHGGWEDIQLPGSAFRHECACACRKFILNHKPGAIIGWANGDEAGYKVFDAADTCVERRVCGRCNQEITTADTYGGTWYASSHFISETGIFTQFVKDGINYCATKGVCNHQNDEAGRPMGCGKEYIEWGSHADCELAEDCSEIEGDDDNHFRWTPCMNGFRGVLQGVPKTSWHQGANTNWCGFCFSNEVPHNYSAEYRFKDHGETHGVYQYCLNENGEKDTTHCGHESALEEEAHLFVTTNCVYINSSQHRIYKECQECHHPATETAGHEVGTYSYGNPTDTTHDVSNFCSRCAHSYFVTTTNHEFSATSRIVKYLNNAYHQISNECSKCNYIGLERTESHTYSPQLSPIYKYLNSDNHSVSNYCITCTNWYASAPANHHIDNVLYAYFSPTQHYVTNHCDKCDTYYAASPEKQAHFKDYRIASIGPFHPLTETTHTATNYCGGEGCGVPFLDSEECANFKVVSLGEESDSESCGRCGNYLGLLPHHWVSDGPTKHHCSNGIGHLTGDHTWSSESLPRYCTLCGESQGDVYTTNYCGNCSMVATGLRCYEVLKNGDFNSSMCASGWNQSNHKCGCYFCQSGSAGNCLCTYSSINKGSNSTGSATDPFAWPFAGSNSN